MQEIITQNVDFIIKNVKSLINASNDSEIAAFFGVKSGTVSAWRSRNSINYDLLIAKCRENNWDLHQIVFGETTNRSPLITKNIKQPMSEDTQNAFIKLILEKDKEIRQLAEELGAIKQELREFKKKSGYQNSSFAAES